MIFFFFSLNNTRHQSGPCLKFEVVLLTMRNVLDTYLAMPKSYHVQYILDIATAVLLEYLCFVAPLYSQTFYQHVIAQFNFITCSTL
jgi:hypothetical protein